MRKALEVARDPDYRFDLAITMNSFEIAKGIAEQLASEARWKQLGEMALADGQLELAEQCLDKSSDLSGQMLMFTATGNRTGMQVILYSAALAIVLVYILLPFTLPRFFSTALFSPMFHLHSVSSVHYNTADFVAPYIVAYQSCCLEVRVTALSLQELCDKARSANKLNVSFLAAFLLQDTDTCLEILVACGRWPEAAFFARTYRPSRCSEMLQLWKEDLKKVNARAAEALADPAEYPNLFPDWDLALGADRLYTVSQEDHAQSASLCSAMSGTQGCPKTLVGRVWSLS